MRRNKETPTIAQYKKSVRRFEHRHHIFASMLIGSAIVLLWRGIWSLADIYLFPNQDVVSAGLSILIGFVILYLRDFDVKEFL